MSAASSLLQTAPLRLLVITACVCAGLLASARAQAPAAPTSAAPAPTTPTPPAPATPMTIPPIPSPPGQASAPPVPQPTPLPPVARRVPHVVTSPHGERVDEYHWLRDDHAERKRPEVMDHLRAENAYTEAVLAPQAALIAQLEREMRGRIKEDDSGPPVYDRGYWYWSRFEKGDEYPQYLRSRGTPQVFDPAAPVETVLDARAMAQGHAFFQIGSMDISPDGRYVAFTQDTVGRRGYTLRVRDLATGTLLPLSIGGVMESVVWAADGRMLIYQRQDPQLLQSGPVMLHVLGTAPETDALVYDEPDKTLFTHISASASRAFVLIAIDGFDTTELRAIGAARPLEAPRVVLPRRAGVRAYADHLHDRWVIRTNEGARNFRLVAAPQAAPNDRRLWRELIRHRPNAALEGFALFNDGIVVQERVDANARVRVLPWGPRAAGRKAFVVEADEAAFTMSLGHALDAGAATAQVRYESMITPERTYAIDLMTGRRTLVDEQTVPGYDRSRYRTERVWAPARDGQRVPVTLVWRADRWQRDGRAPLLLQGYGAYGFSFDPEFDVLAPSLLDRGFAVAIAHVRGGAELGEDWYEAGRLAHKRNTFNDFIDVTDFLVRDRYAAADKVFALGGSAGGLLMGVLANEAASRYRGIVMQVPFVDVVTTMLDETIPLTTQEWTQWGDPRDKRFHDLMLSYSPYDNLGRRAYPALFVSAGLWDAQVQYFEPVKYVARLRHLKTDGNPLLLHVDLDAGHGGKSGRFESLRAAAKEYAFMLMLLGGEHDAPARPK
jgi:oligopeptidase B